MRRCLQEEYEAAEKNMHYIRIRIYPTNTDSSGIFKFLKTYITGVVSVFSRHHHDQIHRIYEVISGNFDFSIAPLDDVCERYGVGHWMEDTSLEA